MSNSDKIRPRKSVSLSVLAAALLLVGCNISNAGALVILEAETGVLGSSLVIRSADGVTYITNTNNNTAYNPGVAARVATYTVTFPEPGTYDLYARIRIGPGGANDDSFLYGNGFGFKSPGSDADWILCNNLWNVGFTNPADIVTGAGTVQTTNVWKWLNVSEFNGGEAPITFTVTLDNLTQTFQIGGREDGLDIDKFVFGTADMLLAVSNLDNGTLPPSPPPLTNVFDGPWGIALHRFSPLNNSINADGAYPVTRLGLVNGVLCGTTLLGGTNGAGTAFLMSTDGSNFAVLRTFGGAGGAAYPAGDPTAYETGFFGASLSGGSNGAGTVFFAQTNGSVVVLHHFMALHADTGTNFGGASPCGLLAFPGGMLYGTAIAGGVAGNGTVFALSTDGASFCVLHDFSALDPVTGTNADGARPVGGVILSGDTLYGTASVGGACGQGVVFSIRTNGTDFNVLHSFSALDPVNATNEDGAIPYGGLVLSGATLYGTTFAGGHGGRGTIFSIQTNGSNFVVLHHFSATDPVTRTNADGAAPAAGLTVSGHTIYGTASAGGTGAAGTVFSFDPCNNRIFVIHSFDPVNADGTNAHGAFPVSEVRRVGGCVYGTTACGGPGGAGTVFGIPAPAQAAVITNISRDTGGGITLFFRGTPNSTNVIQSSASLSEPIIWQDVSTNLANNDGTWQFTDQINGPWRFYRSYER